MTTTSTGAIAIALVAALPTAGFAQGFGQASGGLAMVREIGLHDSAAMIAVGGDTSSAGIGFTGEVGVLVLPEAFKTFPGGSGFSPAVKAPTIMVGPSYHFKRISGLRPYVDGGVTLLLGRESVAMFEARAGVDRWISDHLGVRLEAQDVFVPMSATPIVLGIRMGVLFR